MASSTRRAFPSVAVRTSGGQHVLATVPAEPALVIATPGAEPVAPGGYAAALLLDGWALLGRPSLRAAEEALRRWMNAAALVRPGGTVVVLAESTHPDDLLADIGHADKLDRNRLAMAGRGRRLLTRLTRIRLGQTRLRK